MKDFVYLWLLRYFAHNPCDYSLQYIVEELEISYERLDRLLTQLIDDYLIEQKDGALYITFEGRILLQNESMEDIKFPENYNNITFEKGMDLSTPFLERKFSQKNWFGNRK